MIKLIKIGVLHPKYCCSICSEAYTCEEIQSPNGILISNDPTSEKQTLHFKCYKTAFTQSEVVTTSNSKIELIYQHKLKYGMQMNSAQPIYTKKMILGHPWVYINCTQKQKEEFKELLELQNEKRILSYEDFLKHFLDFEGEYNVVDSAEADICVNIDWFYPGKETQIPELFACGLLTKSAEFPAFLARLIFKHNEISKTKLSIQTIDQLSPAKTNVLSVFISTVGKGLATKNSILSSFLDKTKPELLLERFKNLVDAVYYLEGTVNLRDNDGDSSQNTPLIWSVCDSLFEYSKILIAKGADVCARSGNEKSVFNWFLYARDRIDEKLFRNYIDLFEGAAGKNFLIKEEENGLLEKTRNYSSLTGNLKSILTLKINEAKKAIEKIELVKSQLDIIQANEPIRIILKINGQEQKVDFNSRNMKEVIIKISTETQK
jgi:hypothetical protein